MTTIQFNQDGLIINAVMNEMGIFGFNPLAPRLVIPMEFKHVSSPVGVAFELSSMYGTLSAGQGGTRGIVGDSLPCVIERFARHASHVQLSFPMDYRRLQCLEEIRAGGESMAFSLNLQLTFKKLNVLDSRPQDALHSYISETSCNVCDYFFAVPRDRWLSVLESTGFSKVHVFECPAVPVEQCDTLKNAFAALQSAQRLHRLGFYDKAVGECRIALDKFWDERPKRLKDEWAALLGDETHEWIGDALTAIRRGANPTHHTAGSHFDQLQSQAFIAITGSLVAYVARAGVTE